MNTELIKKLKEAGFLFKEDKCFSPECTCENVSFDGSYLTPTLSELIEACGENFGGLELGYINTETEVKTWYARSPKNKIGGDGPTPEEAVANLWLALNKK